MESILGKIKRLVWSIFPPNSGVELFLRTLYHQISATRVYSKFLIRQSQASYPKFLKAQDEWLRSKQVPQAEGPRITFFLPIMPGQSGAAEKTIRSIAAQRVANWQLLIGTETEDALSITNRLTPEDKDRVGFLQSSPVALGTFLARCPTDYFVCCCPGDQFSIYFTEWFLRSYQASPSAAIYYADNDTSNGGTEFPTPHFKPEQYSPELHLSTNYLSRSILSTPSAKTALVGINQKTAFLVQEYELLLVICREKRSIIHIPWMLVHQPQPADGNWMEVEEMLRRHLSKKGLRAKQISRQHGYPHLQWVAPQPLVSIIIPTKNQLALLKDLLESIFSVTHYAELEVILVDNASTDPGVLDYYEQQAETRPVRWLEYDEPFNYSRANNLGAAQADGEIFLFMNNDMIVLHPEWLSELTQWTCIAEIGMVGAKLIRPNKTIQHAGLVMGLLGSVGHLYLNTPEDYHGLVGSVNWYRNVSAVTGACQMMRRDVFEELGGYDEGYQLVLSDVEMCLRLLNKGYRILYNPFATLVHQEGASRGYSTPNQDFLRGYQQMGEQLLKGDPYFSPNLTYTPIPRCSFDPEHHDHRIEHIQSRRLAMMNKRSRPD